MEYQTERQRIIKQRVQAAQKLVRELELVTLLILEDEIPKEVERRTRI